MTLLVTLHSRADSNGRLREELAVLTARSRADAGCLRYDALEDLEGPGRFVLWEEWIDEESLADHNSTGHVTGFLESSTALLAAPMQVQRLRRTA